MIKVIEGSCAHQYKHHAKERQRSEPNTILKKRKDERNTNAETARNQKCFVQTSTEFIQKERLGRYLIGRNKYPDEKAHGKHHHYFGLIFWSYI